MKIEDQACSLESAKKLDELGVKRESYFRHCYRRYDDPQKNDVVISPSWPDQKDDIPAYTVAELLSLNVGWEITSDGSGGWFIKASSAPVNHYSKHILGLADGLCCRLIWLLENGHVTAEEINND